MAKAVVQVEGLRELQKALKGFGDKELLVALREANKSIAQKVVDRALPNVPRGKTGDLAASVKALSSQTAARVKAGTASVAYAGAIHWGRKKGGSIQGRPFLIEAQDALQGDFGDEYEATITDLLQQTIDRSLT